MRTFKEFRNLDEKFHDDLFGEYTHALRNHGEDHKKTLRIKNKVVTKYGEKAFGHLHAAATDYASGNEHGASKHYSEYERHAMDESLELAAAALASAPVLHFVGSTIGDAIGNKVRRSIEKHNSGKRTDAAIASKDASKLHAKAYRLTRLKSFSKKHPNKALHAKTAAKYDQADAADQTARAAAKSKTDAYRSSVASDNKTFDKWGAVGLGIKRMLHKEEKQTGWTCSNDKHCGGNIFDRVYSDELKAPVKKCRNCGTEHPFKKRVTQKSVRRAAAHERLTSYMAKYNLDESMAVFKRHNGNVLPPIKPVRDNEPLLDKIRRIIKKKRLGIKEGYRRAADHEHSMARRYLEQMDDGKHLAIKSVGVHDKKGHVHIHYAAKGQVGGGRYVVLDKHGKEMDLKKK